MAKKKQNVLRQLTPTILRFNRLSRAWSHPPPEASEVGLPEGEEADEQ